jgi:hypothetical protein
MPLQLVFGDGEVRRKRWSLLETHESSSVLSGLSAVESNPAAMLQKEIFGFSRLDYSSGNAGCRSLPLQRLMAFHSILRSVQFDQFACGIILKFPARKLICSKKSPVQINAERSYVNLNAS